MSKKKSLWQIPAVLTIAALSLLLFTDSAGQTDLQKKITRSELSAKKNEAFVPLQFSLAPEFGGGIFPSDVPVYGFSFGGMVCQKELHGLNVAALHAYNLKKSGVSLSLLDFCQDSYGLSLFAGGGSVNNHGVSIGLWNGTEWNDGFQFGLVNQAKENLLLAPELQRPQRGHEEFGVQTGLINHSEGRGIQFGLWNTNPKAWIPAFPLFNFAL